MRTHYISASSNIIPQVRELAHALSAHSVWCLNHDWTKSFDGPVLNPTALAHLDLECAVLAQDFIFLDSEHFSRGGMMEYGARLRDTGTVHHIGCRDKDYLFFQHQSVIHYATVADFLEIQRAVDLELSFSIEKKQWLKDLRYADNAIESLGRKIASLEAEIARLKAI